MSKADLACHCECMPSTGLLPANRLGCALADSSPIGSADSTLQIHLWHWRVQEQLEMNALVEAVAAFPQSNQHPRLLGGFRHSLNDYATARYSKASTHCTAKGIVETYLHCACVCVCACVVVLVTH